jgi:hypothetical protein
MVSGFCVFDYPEGERFSFMIMDGTEILEQGFRAIWTLLSEGELRAQLALIWFSAPDSESGIQVARTWSTTVTHARGSIWISEVTRVSSTGPGHSW